MNFFQKSSATVNGISKEFFWTLQCLTLSLTLTLAFTETAVAETLCNHPDSLLLDLITKVLFIPVYMIPGVVILTVRSKVITGQSASSSSYAQNLVRTVHYYITSTLYYLLYLLIYLSGVMIYQGEYVHDTVKSFVKALLDPENLQRMSFDIRFSLIMPAVLAGVYCEAGKSPK